MKNLCRERKKKRDREFSIYSSVKESQKRSIKKKKKTISQTMQLWSSLSDNFSQFKTTQLRIK